MRSITYSLTYCTYSTHITLISFFFNDTATTEIYTLSLHDALPIFRGAHRGRRPDDRRLTVRSGQSAGDHPACSPDRARGPDRKSTRLNSSHVRISYAVFCLKKKKQISGIEPVVDLALVNGHLQILK